MTTQIKRWAVAFATAMVCSMGLASAGGDNAKWTIVRAGATNEYEKLSSALADLREGDTLAPFVAGDKATFAKDNLNPVSVDCPFVITTSGVTIDFRHRAITDSIATAEIPAELKGRAHMVVFKDGAKNVTVKDGFLFGSGYDVNSSEPKSTDRRLISVNEGSEVTVEGCVMFGPGVSEILRVSTGAKLVVRDSCFDGQGDGCQDVVLVTGGSTLEFDNVRGFWNPNDFWGTADGVNGTFTEITGEQFAIADGSTLVLNKTAISNNVTQWISELGVSAVVARGEGNRLVLGDGSMVWMGGGVPAIAGEGALEISGTGAVFGAVTGENVSFKGGSYGFDPTGRVADGFTATFADGRWTVASATWWKVFSKNGLQVGKFDKLSEALAALEDGSTLQAFPSGDSFGTFSRDRLNPVSVDCPFVITNSDVTVDLNGRALTTSVAYDGFVELDGTMKKNFHLITVIAGAKNVTVKNGYLFGTTWREDPTLTAADKRALHVGMNSEATVSSCKIFAAALADMIKVDGGSKLAIADSYLDGQGDGSEGTIRVRRGSTLVLKDVKGFWDPDNFWGVTDGVVDSLDAITGEQFVLEDGKLVLNNTSISNTITHWSQGYLAKPVVVSGKDNKLVTKNGAQIVAIGLEGETAPLISMKSPTVECPETELVTPGRKFEPNKEIVAASSLASVALVGTEPSRYRVVTDIERIVKDLGIEKITVEAPSNCTDGAVASCITVKTTEGSFLEKLYGQKPDLEKFVEVAYALPSNVLTAVVLNNDLKWAKDLNDKLREFEPEIAELLSAFSNIVDGVTGGIAVCDMPDESAANGLGRLLIAGVKGVEVWTKLTNELSRAGEIIEKEPLYQGDYHVYLKPNSRLGMLLGGAEPQLTFGRSVLPGKFILIGNSSDSVYASCLAQADEDKTLLANPTFKACAGDLLAKADRGFRYVSPEFLKVAGLGVHRMIGIDPGLITGLGEFWMFSTKTYDLSTHTASYLMRMPKGASGTAEAVGRLALRFFENLHPELAPLVSFAEDYEPTDEAKERLVQMSDALLFLRNTLGVDGLDFTAEEPELGVAKTDVRFGTERNGALARLLTNGESGHGVAERYIPATAVAAWGFQPDAELGIDLTDRILTALGVSNVAEVVRAYRNRGENFAPDAALAVTVGDAKHEHEGGVSHGGVNLIAVQRILNKNLWTSIQIMLQQSGGTVSVSDNGTIVCKLPVPDNLKTLLPYLEPALCYVPEDGMLVFSTSSETAISAARAGRHDEGRLIESETFLSQMGGTFPVHQTFRYIAPKADADLISSLGELLKRYVPEALLKAILSFDITAVWSTGVGNQELRDVQVLADQAVYIHKGRTSSSLYESGKTALDAAIAALAESVSLAYPYDYTRARRFVSSLVTLNIDSVDENGKCRVRMIRRTIFEGAQDVTIDGEITVPEDRTEVTQHVITYQNLTVKFILSSEGVFGFDASNDGRGSHSFILRESLFRPDFGDKGLSPEEIDREVKEIWAELGIKDIIVRKPVADEPEETVRTKVEIDTTLDSFFRDLYRLEPDPAEFVNLSTWMPPHALVATLCNCDLQWAVTAEERLREHFPDIADLLKAFRGVADGVSGGYCLCTVPDAEATNGLGKVFMVGVTGIEAWDSLTNKLSRSGDLIPEPKGGKAYPVVYLKPTGAFAQLLLGGREPHLAFVPVADGKSIIAGYSSETVREDCLAVWDRGEFLHKNPTFLECAGPLLQDAQRGFKYVSPEALEAFADAAHGLLNLPIGLVGLDDFWSFSIIETTTDQVIITSRMSQRSAEVLEAVGRLGVSIVGNWLPTIKGTVRFEEEEYEPSEAAKEHIDGIVNLLSFGWQTLGVTGLDYRYQPETAEARAKTGIPETGGDFVAEMLSVKTPGEDSPFLRLIASGEPDRALHPSAADANAAERYLPDTATQALAFQPDSKAWMDIFCPMLEVLGYENVAKVIRTAFPAESDRHSCVFALTSDEAELVKTDDGKFTYASPGILIVSRIGTEEAFRKTRETLGTVWELQDEGDLLVYRRKEGSEALKALCLAFHKKDGMSFFATSRRLLDQSVAAGVDKRHCLYNDKDFLRVMGNCIPHNTLRYRADNIFGRSAKQLANLFSNILPEGLITQILSMVAINQTGDCDVGVKKGDTYFRYGRGSWSPRYESFLAIARAAFQTAGKAMQKLYPYDGTKARVFESVFTRRDIGTVDDGVAVVRIREDAAAVEASGWTFDARDFDGTDETVAADINKMLTRDGSAYALSDRVLLGFWSDERTGAFSMSLENKDATPELGVSIDVEGASQAGVVVLTPNTAVEIPVTVTPATATLTAKSLPCGLALKKVTLDAKAKTCSWVLTGNEHHVKTFNTVFTARIGKSRTSEKAITFKVEHYKSDAIRLVDTYAFTAGVPANQYLDLTAIDCTVSGLPSGLKFDKKTGLISGTPAKPGDFLVTFTKKVGKVTEKATATFAVAGTDAITVDIAFGTASKTSQTSQTPQTSQTSLEVYAGVKVCYPISTLGLDGVATTVSAKGLPGGLKLVKTAVYVDPTAKRKVVDHYEYAIEGVPTTASKVDRKTGAITPSKVVVSATNKYKWTGSKAFEMTVLALPGWAVGTFDGAMEEVVGNVVSDKFAVAVGKFSGTVGATGKISLKLAYISEVTGKSATATFSVNGFERYNAKTGEFVIQGTLKTKNAVSELNGIVYEDPETGLGRMQIVDDDYEDFGIIDGVQNGWKLKETDLPSFPTGSKALKLTDEESGLTLKFGAKGAVSFSGKVAGDSKPVSVSGTTQLLPYAYDENVLFAQTLVYVAPKAGLSDGFIKTYDLVFPIGADGKVESVGFVPEATE